MPLPSLSLLLEINNAYVDPLEEHDLSDSNPEIVRNLLAALQMYNASHISQSVMKDPHAKSTEPCGAGLQCSVPWVPHDANDRCKSTSPTPSPPSPGANCCQCLKEQGGQSCEAKCSKKSAACTDCIQQGNGDKCRRECGCN